MHQQIIDGHTITLEDDERQECEIWTRVMGYYRPVSEWNIGKKSERAERVNFSEGKTLQHLEENHAVNT